MMSPDELIRRLHEVIRTAVLDSNVVEDTLAATEAERAAGEHDRRKAEAVRDEVTAELRRLADVINHAEKWENRPPSSPYAMGLRDAWRTILRLARGDTTNQENRSE